MRSAVWIAVGVIGFGSCVGLRGATNPVATSTVAAKQVATVVLLSDIHFDPFPTAQQCARPEGKAAMARLLQGRWDNSDFAFETQPEPGQDTHYSLMISALHAARAAAPDAKLVVVAGDLLAHGVREEFRGCAPGASQEQFTRFAADAIIFVTRSVTEAFPRAQVIPVLGNNDGDGENYQLGSRTLLDLVAPTWKRAAGKRADFSSFARGGYFSAQAVGWKHLRVIGLNSVLWSAKFNPAGQDTTAAGDAELEWLQAQLELANHAHDRVLMVGHIPPGLDAYATRMARGASIVSMYRDCGEIAPATGCRDYSKAVPAMLVRFSSTIVMGIFGHTHQNEFRVAGQGQSAVAIQVVPSISPIFQNNPAFLVADTGPLFEWNDVQAWNLPLSDHKTGWQREFSFNSAYGESVWNANSLLTLADKLRDDQRLREQFFLRLPSGNPDVAVPPKWQDAYLCGLTHLTAAEVVPCVAAAQLDLPLP